MPGPKKLKSYRAKFGSAGKTFNGRAHIDQMYDHEWRAYSERFLKYNSRCYACGDRAQAVDHLVPHKGSEYLFKSTTNHLPLCHSCHNTITNKFDRNFVSGADITPKLKWIADKRGQLNVVTKVKVLPSYER